MTNLRSAKGRAHPEETGKIGSDPLYTPVGLAPQNTTARPLFISLSIFDSP